MTVAELIKELQEIENQDRPIFFFNTYTTDLMEVESIDTGISDRVDINIK